MTEEEEARKYAALVISMAADYLAGKITVGTFISNLKLIAAQIEGDCGLKG